MDGGGQQSGPGRGAAAGGALDSRWLPGASGWTPPIHPPSSTPTPPSTHSFTTRLQFPGLINGCTIDWYLPWPEEALTAVASKFLDAAPLECTPEVRCRRVRAAGPAWLREEHRWKAQ